MQQVLNDSLLKITKGAGIAFIGSLAGLFLAFVGRLLVARYGTEAEYGIFSLALVVLNICAVIATLGLDRGVTRSIAYAKGKNETEKVQVFMSASLWFSLIASVILGVSLFLTSGIIGGSVFHEPGLVSPLRIFAAAMPFFVLIIILVSMFRGFEQIMPQVYFQDVLRNMLFVLLLLGVILLNLSFARVFHAYLLSLSISFVALVIYAAKRLPLPLKFTATTRLNPVTKEILLFSLPLLGVAMLQMIITWTDTLMLGYFKTSADVGLYNAAFPLARFIYLPLSALWLIYMPVTSGLYAEGLLSQIKRNIVILTKWLCSAIWPLFLIFFLFPETVLFFFFGTSYTPAAGALRILSLGLMIYNFLGLAGSSLIALGQSVFIMWTTLAAAVLNIVLNILLIPLLGIEGAAIASASALTCSASIRCWKLYSLTRAQPFSRNLVKPILVSVGLVPVIYFVAVYFLSITFWMLPLLFILYYATYCLVVLVSKSFDKEDIALLLTIEKRAGIDATLINKVLRKFL